MGDKPKTSFFLNIISLFFSIIGLIFFWLFFFAVGELLREHSGSPCWLDWSNVFGGGMFPFAGMASLFLGVILTFLAIWVSARKKREETKPT